MESYVYRLFLLQTKHENLVVVLAPTHSAPCIRRVVGQSLSICESTMRKSSFFSSTSTSTSTLIYHYTQTDGTTLKSTQIPITSSTEEQPTVPITVHLPTSSTSIIQPTAATKIQSAYRSYVIRKLYKIISAVNSETNRLQDLIQQQDTVDSIRSHEREKLKMNEALMSLLLTLDSVPGTDQSVREARRKVSRRIVGLQEILDGVSDSRVEDLDELMRNWEETVVEMEGYMWEDRSRCERREMERFCFEKLGFRCMERFLRGA